VCGGGGFKTYRLFAKSDIGALPAGDRGRVR
jgi:hypothetical protein